MILVKQAITEHNTPKLTPTRHYFHPKKILANYLHRMTIVILYKSFYSLLSSAFFEFSNFSKCEIPGFAEIFTKPETEKEKTVRFSKYIKSNKLAINLPSMP